MIPLVAGVIASSYVAPVINILVSGYSSQAIPSNNFTMSLPANVAGDTALLITTRNGNAGNTLPGGWTSRYYNYTGANGETAIYSKAITSPLASVTISGSASGTLAGVAYAIILKNVHAAFTSQAITASMGGSNNTVVTPGIGSYGETGRMMMRMATINQNTSLTPAGPFDTELGVVNTAVNPRALNITTELVDASAQSGMNFTSGAAGFWRGIIVPIRKI